MGAMAEASCECGYTSSLFLGGGRATFETECWFPAYCRACRALVESNLRAQPVTCPECGATDVVTYDAPELIGAKGKREIFSWEVDESSGRTLSLTDGRYLCPACQKPQLRFQHTGHWD